ncbi:MAG: preprotein translocase subunit SecE [Cellvibrionales bacterium]|jgi:preprotein translocase subunit SecE|nr:preprotein translocase subunit SecE [Cellvibrionales bacterium]
MNSKAEVQGTKGLDKNLDFLKWAAAGLLTMGGIFAFYHFSQYPTAYRAVALLPVVAASLFFVSLTTQGGGLFTLLREAVVETRRVVWPTRQETIQTTLVVVAFVFVMALILWGLDAAFGKLISLIIG